MRIAFLTPQYFPTLGGVPVLVDLLGEGFRRMGHEVRVLLGEGPEDGQQAGKFAPVKCASATQLMAELRGAHAIVSLQECLSLTWPLALGLVRRPTTVFLQMHPQRGRGLRAFPKRLLRRRLLLSSRVCACSDYIAADVRKEERVPVRVVHNPYNEQLFVDRPAVYRDIDILYVGRLAIHKRCDVLLQALAIREQAGIKHKVVIAGDGPEESALKAMAAELRLSNCSFVGPVNQAEAASLMRKSKTLVVPSGYEPFGIVVLEGLASGCQVVTSDAGGLREAGGEFARTFHFNDAADLARVLEKNRFQAPSLRAQPTSLVQWLEGLSPTAVAQRLLDVLPRMD